DGAQIIIGRAQWLKDNGIKDDLVKSVDLNETEGFSLVFVARNGRCIGWVGLQDQTRPEAPEALAALKQNHVRRIAMVSGDRQPRAVINQNFLFGVCFIIGGWTAGAFGYLNPIIAAILHNAGSLIVVFNSARLVRLGEELEPFQTVAAEPTDKGPGPVPQLAP